MLTLRAFATLSATVVVAATAQAELVSDDFNKCELNQNTWTLVDPASNATLNTVGTGTSDAWLAITVPPLVTGSPPSYAQLLSAAVRLVQTASERNFNVQVKYESPLTAGYRLQGLMAGQPGGDHVSIALIHNGNGTRVVALSASKGNLSTLADVALSGGAPVWLSIQRTGNSWPLSYSTNGSIWTILAKPKLNLTNPPVGPMAANLSVGQGAAFTSHLDYFLNTADPFAAEDGGGATLTRTVVGQGTITAEPDQEAYLCDEVVTVTATPAAGWSFQGWSGDLSGTNPVQQLSMTTSRAVQATFVEQAQALTIQNVAVSTLENSAQFTVDTSAPAAVTVRYGNTSAYELGQVQNTAYATRNVLTIEGLTPATQYHYGITATSQEGDSAGTPDAVFTTAAAPQSGAPVSDDFNSSSINTSLWTVVNPLGDATFSTVGTNTPDARLRIEVPGGPSHSIWTDGINAPRVMQQVDDIDFSVQAKFDSAMSSKYQLQGIVVEGENQHYLRIEFYHDGAGYHHFAASFGGGQAGNITDLIITGGAPIYLRVSRTGDSWLAQYSNDGQAWQTGAAFTHAMVVHSVGPYAGNQGVDAPAPAFVGLIDYFFNTASPIVPEDGGGTGTTLTRTVSGQGSIVVQPDQAVYYNNEVVTVTAVPADGWSFQVWSGDLTGTNPVQTLTMNASHSIHATFVEQSSPIQITNVQVSPSSNSARITVDTDVASTAVVFYGQTEVYELGQVQSTTFQTRHTIDLVNLLPETQYHYQVTCTGQQGQTASTDDAVFTTLALPPGGVKSDDFNTFNLNPQVWTIVDPLGDAEFSLVGTNTANARLQIKVPAGSDHYIWSDGLNAPRVMQQVDDTDFSVEARFDSLMNSHYQMQGILVEGADQRHLRIEFYHDGRSHYHFVAALGSGGAITVINRSIPGGPPLYLRVSRSGDSWLTQYSGDGQSWQTGASFSYPMAVRAVGPYIGNEGSPAPEFVGLIDYFFNTAQPVIPEDGSPATDQFGPNIFSVTTASDSKSISVNWKTDEPASSAVQYGQTTAYELGTISDPVLKRVHGLTVSGLAPSTTYNLRVRGTDAAGNTGASGNLTVTTGTGPGGPTIVLWYGDTQEFGRWGVPQPRADVLGNVSSPYGISSLSYSLNGGAFRAMNMGPNTMRLASQGDFIADLLFSDLRSGSNSLLIRAVDGQGAVNTRTVNVIDSSGPIWPLPYSVNWSSTSNINSVAQVTDGLWAIQGNYVRPLVMAYDRLIAIGDLSWRNYEVTVPITVHATDPNGYAPPSYGPGVGLLLRWPGHSNDGGQPVQGVYPLGGIGMFRWTSSYERFEIFGNNGYLLATDNSGEKLVLGRAYIFKMRVVTTQTNRAEYSFKWWPANNSEPASWRLVGSQSISNDPGSGSLLLLAHHVDALFGNVSVVPLP